LDLPDESLTNHIADISLTTFINYLNKEVISEKELEDIHKLLLTSKFFLESERQALQSAIFQIGGECQVKPKYRNIVRKLREDGKLQMSSNDLGGN